MDDLNAEEVTHLRGCRKAADDAQAALEAYRAAMPKDAKETPEGLAKVAAHASAVETLRGATFDALRKAADRVGARYIEGARQVIAEWKTLAGINALFRGHLLPGEWEKLVVPGTNNENLPSVKGATRAEAHAGLPIIFNGRDERERGAVDAALKLLQADLREVVGPWFFEGRR